MPLYRWEVLGLRSVDESWTCILMGEAHGHVSIEVALLACYRRL